jgi:hypothetical protein
MRGVAARAVGHFDRGRLPSRGNRVHGEHGEAAGRRACRPRLHRLGIHGMSFIPLLR